MHEKNFATKINMIDQIHENLDLTPCCVDKDELVMILKNSALRLKLLL